MSAEACLEVSGGAGGTAVELDDLDHAVTRLQHSAADLHQASAHLRWGKSVLQGLDGVLADPGAALALEGELLAVHHELESVALSTEGLAQLVAACATGYRTADEASRNRWAAFGALVGALSPAAFLASRVLTDNLVEWKRAPSDGDGTGVTVTASPSAGGHLPPPGQGAVLGPPSGATSCPTPATPGISGLLPATADPQLAQVPGRPVPALPVAGASGGPAAGAAEDEHPDGLTVLGRYIGQGEEPLIGLLAGVLAGPAVLAGRPAAPLLSGRAAAAGGAPSTATVVTPRPVPAAVAAAGAPTGVGDVLRRLEDTHEAPRSELRVRVERTTHADGSTSVVVYLPGTKKWTSASDNPADLDAILQGMAGEPSALTDAALKAMEEAGVRPGEPVLLAGYSLGGITAAQMAADSALHARFDVQGLVTAGSPIGHFDIPSDVQTVSLEHPEDLVPHLDGAENTSLKSSQVTVTAPTPGQLGAHEIEGYVQLAEAVDTSRDPSLRASRAGLAQFYAEPGDTTRVTEVAATRVGP